MDIFGKSRQQFDSMYCPLEATLCLLGKLSVIPGLDDLCIVKLPKVDCPGYVDQEGDFITYYSEIDLKSIVNPINPSFKHVKAIVYVKNGDHSVSNVCVWLFYDIETKVYDLVSKKDCTSLNDVLDILAWSNKFNVPKKMYIRGYLDIPLEETRYFYIQLDKHYDLDYMAAPIEAINPTYMYYNGSKILRGHVKWLPDEKVVLDAKWYNVFLDDPENKYIHTVIGENNKDLNNKLIFDQLNILTNNDL